MNITVIGGGFAALTAIRQLRKQQTSANITLINPSSTFVYYPSLIWVPTGQATEKDIHIDITAFLAEQNITHIKASVTGISNQGRTVHTNQGDIENDGLIIASGGRFIKKLPGIEHAITLCEGFSAADQIRQRLAAMRQTGGKIAFGFASNPNEPAAMRGGPMFELMFGIDNWMRSEGIRDRFELTFFSPAARPGQRLGEQVVDNLLKRLKDKNIIPQLGHKLVRFEADKVITEGTEFASDLILFMPGMTGPAWADQVGIELSSGGFLPSDRTTKVKGLERTYVAGDSGSYANTPDWLPKQAHMADLQAETAVTNLLAELKQQPATAEFKAEIICIMDMHDRAVYIKRDERGQTMLPPCRLMHYAKKFFEWWYLRHYRR